MAIKKRPIIGVIAHTKQFGGWNCYSAHKKYILPLNRNDVTSVLIPAHDDKNFYKSIADRLDGFVFTGARSNIHPEHYNGVIDERYGPFDTERDTMSFAFFEAMLKAEKPFLAICRGLQDLNVFMGGTLIQSLPDTDSKVKHHILNYETLEQAYKNRHEITVAKKTPLHSILGVNECDVNSVHRQGINALGKDLVANATAPDGLIEAVSIKNYKTFGMGVQWHPEYDFAWDDNSAKLYQAFSKSAFEYIG